jgi:hypothetical protein
MFDWFTALVASIPWVLVIGLLVYFIKNPEKVEKWSSIIARSLSFVSSRWENASVAKDIQADINDFARTTNAGMANPVLPYGVKISWVLTTSREAFVKEGKVVIKMQKHQNQARNFLYALMEWTYKGVIPESRHLMNEVVLKSIDFAFINKVLTEKNRQDSKELFLDEFYESEVSKGSLLEKYCTAFNRLDKMGLFTGVVLPEYSLLGQRIGSSMPNDKIKAETIGFATMLERLSRKTSGEDVSPDYKGENIKCSVVLIARPEKYLEQGLSPYLNFINKCCEEGVCSLYVSAIGDANIPIARKIRDAYEKSKKILFVWEKTQSLGITKSTVLFFKALKPEQSG